MELASSFASRGLNIYPKTAFKLNTDEMLRTYLFIIVHILNSPYVNDK